MTLASLTKGAEPMSIEQAVTFEGIQSGDHESFCWDVSREEFIRLCKRKPIKGGEESFFNPGLYRINPGYDIPSPYPTLDAERLRITISVKQSDTEFEATVKAVVIKPSEPTP